MKEPVVYLSGEWVPASQAAIPIYDKGIVLGATVTEMTRTYNQELFRLEDHLDRLYASLAYTDIDPGLGKPEMAQVSRDLVAENRQGLGPGEELGLIHFVTAGKVPLYAGRPLTEDENCPTVCIHTFPLDCTLYAGAMQYGYHLITPSIRHIPPQCLDPKIKYRSRLHWHLADRETHLVDSKATSLLLDLEGNITECSGANILVCKAGTIYSPTLRNILPGVSRKIVIELAEKLKIPFEERELQVYDVINADEALLCSTPFGICPATRVNGLSIGSGEPGLLWKALAEAWSDLVGFDIVAQVLKAPQNA